MIDVTTDGLTLSGTVGWAALLTYATLLAALGFSLLMVWRGHVPLPRNFRRDWRKTSLNIYTVVLVPVWVILFGAVGLTTLSMFANPPDPDTDPLAIRLHYLALVGFVGVLGGIVSLPLSLMRAEANERQTKAAEGQVDTALAQVEVAQQGQVTDRINKAVEGLGAEKTVSRIGRVIKVRGADGMLRQEIKWTGGAIPERAGDEFEFEGDWQAFSETIPNLEVRIGAIYALERIAQDSDRDHIQIMEILCAYIRENAPWSVAEPFPEEWVEAFAADWDAKGVKRPDREAIEEWAGDLKEPRTDIQAALEVIGRRSEKQIALERAASVRGSDVGYQLDLRGTCLQGADMAQMNLEHVQLTVSQMQRANLDGAQLQGADLTGAHLQEADLRRAQLQNADLKWAQLHFTHLLGVQLQGATLHWVQLQGADLSWAELHYANLRNADLRGANLLETQLQGANLGEAMMQRLNLSGLQLQGAHLNEAHLQGANLRGAQLQGADLRGAHMEGADLFGAQFDSSTFLRAAALRGAALRDVDCSTIPFSQEQIEEAFGDASVTLGDLKKPAHWDQGQKPLRWEEFEEKWHAYMRSIGMDPAHPG